MRVAIIGISVGLVLSCSPDFAANAAQRCDDDLECGVEGVCYRGFCLADPADPGSISTRDAGAVSASENPPTEDGGVSSPAADSSTPAASSNAAAAPTDAGGASSAATGAAPSASGTTQSDASIPAAPGQNTPATTPPAQPSDAGSGTAGGSTGNGAKAPGNTPPAGPADAGPPTKPSAPPTSDAAAPAPTDAGTPLPGNCTLEECCAEALGQTPAGKGEGKDDDDDEDAKQSTNNPGKKAKKCGCSDPALLRTLTCGVLGPLGAIL